MVSCVSKIIIGKPATSRCCGCYCSKDPKCHRGRHRQKWQFTPSLTCDAQDGILARLELLTSDPLHVRRIQEPL